MSVEKKSLECVCGKFYSSRPSLCVHRKKCAMFLESKICKRVNLDVEGNTDDDLSVSSATSSKLAQEELNADKLRLIELENKLKLKELELQMKEMEISNMKTEFSLIIQNKDMEISNLKTECSLKLRIKDLEFEKKHIIYAENVIEPEIVEIANNNNFKVDDEVIENNIKLEIIEIAKAPETEPEIVEITNEIEPEVIDNFDIKKSKIKIKRLPPAIAISNMKYNLEQQYNNAYTEEPKPVDKKNDLNNNTKSKNEPQFSDSALNFTEFIDDIDISLTQLEMLESNGYVECFSKTIIKELNDVGYDRRPFQYDKKNRILYVNNENYEWVEDLNNKYLDLLIKKINKKYLSLIPEYRSNHKHIDIDEHVKNNQYLKIIQELMGGVSSKDAGIKYDPNFSQEHKIIQSILQEIKLKK